MPEFTMIVYLLHTNVEENFVIILYPNVVWFEICLQRNRQGSGTLLVRLYRDAGTPSIGCSLTKFWKALKSKVLGLSLTCYKCFLDVGTMPIESVPHPLRSLHNIYGSKITNLVCEKQITLSLVHCAQFFNRPSFENLNMGFLSEWP